MISYSDEYKQFRLTNELGQEEIVTNPEEMSDIEKQIWGFPVASQFPQLFDCK